MPIPNGLPDGGIFAEIRWSEEDLNCALINAA